MKKNLFENQNFVVGVGMCIIGMMSIPGWSWVKTVDYHSDWIGALVPMAITGIFGAVLVLNILLHYLIRPLIWEAEKRLVRSGWRIGYGWGILFGLAIIFVSVMASVYFVVTTSISGGIILLLAMTNITACSFGATLLSLHNSLAKINGQKIFFLP